MMRRWSKCLVASALMLFAAASVARAEWISFDRSKAGSSPSITA